MQVELNTHKFCNHIYPSFKDISRYVKTELINFLAFNLIRQL